MSIFVFGEDLGSDGELTKGQVIERTILLAGKEYRGQGDDFIEVTPEMLSQAVSNFKAGAAGHADLAANFSHDRSGPAAAWFKGLKVSDDKKELIATLKITGKGATELNEGNYRYPSIEMVTNGFKRNDGVQFDGCVIIGCAFLNNPQQTGIKPVIKFEADTVMAGLDTLSTMELISVIERSLELLVDLSPEDQARLDQVMGKTDPEKTEPVEELKEDDGKEMPEDSARVVKLQDQLDSLQKQNDQSVKKELFGEMLMTGHITPSQKPNFMALDVTQAMAFKNVSMAGKPQIDFTEHGTNIGGREKEKLNEQSGADKFHKLVQLKVKKNNISFSEAMSEVSEENPELNKFVGVA